MTTKASMAELMGDHERHDHPAVVRGAMVSPWDRTHEAVHGRPCPFSGSVVLPP